MDIFILLSGTFDMQVVISDVSEAQLTASKNSLRGGLARFSTVLTCISCELFTF